MRLFTLEYFRQLINADLTHFCNVKKKAQLRIRNQLGPFIINKREAWEDVDKILGEDLKLRKSFCGYHMTQMALSMQEKENIGC